MTFPNDKILFTESKPSVFFRPRLESVSDPPRMLGR